MSDTVYQLNAALDGRYRVDGTIAEGGMAGVYLADDLKHGRRVALKVLKPALAETVGSERFLAEIRATATLHHPHILPLYDSGDANGLLYYVMPYVEGESLAKRLEREPQLPVETAVKIATAIAHALDHAHRHGVIHRDIKPQNILLVDDEPLVADFGIALALETATERITRTGTTLGTPTYMSPEQISGERAIDGRSDVYALGCVLFEMLAGRPPFMGRTHESLLAQHVNADPPDLKAIRSRVTAELAEAVEKALSKAPADRFRSGADFSRALERSVVPSPRAGPTRSTLVGAAALAALSAVALAALFMRPTADSEPVPTPPEPRQMTFRGDVIGSTLSGDARFLAYIAQTGPESHAVFVQEIGIGPPIEIIRADHLLCCVSFSPDNERILLRNGNRLTGTSVILPRLGGSTPRPIASEVIAEWSPDGRRIASWWPQAKRILITDVASGDTTGSVPLDLGHRWLNALAWSPDGRRLAVATAPATTGDPALWTVPLDGGPPTKLLTDSVNLLSPRWPVDREAIYYLRTEEPTWSIWKVAVDPVGSSVEGPDRVLPRAVAYVQSAAVPAMSVSSDGSTLAYVSSTTHSNLWRWSLDSEGDITSSEQLTTGTALRTTPRLSPDESAIVYTEAAGGNHAVFVMELADRSVRQLTFMETPTWSPVWSPDGREIAFGAMSDGEGGIWTVDADGGTPLRLPGTRMGRGDDIAWAPGTEILFQQPDHQNYSLLEPESGSVRDLLPSDDLGWFYEPRYSPDGSGVALRNSAGPPGTIVVVDVADGSWAVATEVFAGPVGWVGNDTIYRLSADARSAVDDELVAVSRTGGEAVSVANLPSPVAVRDMTMSDDGRTLVAAVRTSQSDVWLVENFDPRRR